MHPIGVETNPSIQNYALSYRMERTLQYSPAIYYLQPSQAQLPKRDIDQRDQEWYFRIRLDYGL